MELDAIKQSANELRAAIKRTGELVHGELKQAILTSPGFPDTIGRDPAPGQPDKSEALSNVMLAYRHLEDARMRLGKVIQAMEGGVSIYDREQPPA